MKTHKQQISHRLKIIEGHIKAIQKMVEKDSYCIDIVHQSRAVQKALKRLDMQIIEDHLKNCVIEQAKSGQDKKVVEELIGIYKYK